jgi:hypothetical protein
MTLKLLDLSTDHIYRTPLGRRCRLRPQADDDTAVPWFSFEYLDTRDGFALTAVNVPLLTREVPHGQAAR